MLLTATVGTTYDQSGNTTVDASGRKFIYDGENKQTKVTDGNNNVIGEYTYDGDGRRVKKHVPSTGETTIFVYDASGRLAAEYSTQVETQNPQISYTTSDHLGSPRIITNQAGEVTSRRDLHPFGEETFTIQRTSNLKYATTDNVRQKFTSYERDIETSLDYAVARYFGSSYGRFTSPDPALSSGREALPQSWNRYSYTLNNPLKFIDPMGLYEFDSSLDQVQKDNFLKKMKEMEDRMKALRKTYGEKSDEYKAVKSSYDAICEGAKGCSEKKGGRLLITAGTLEKGVGAEVGRDETTKRAIMTLDSKELSNGDIEIRDIAHEGYHVIDQLNYMDTGIKATNYDTEFGGYLITSLMDEAGGVSSSTKGNFYMYKDVWRTANPKLSESEINKNVSKERKAEVDKLLALPRSQGGLYEVTPNKKNPTNKKDIYFP